MWCHPIVRHYEYYNLNFCGAPANLNFHDENLQMLGYTLGKYQNYFTYNISLYNKFTLLIQFLNGKDDNVQNQITQIFVNLHTTFLPLLGRYYTQSISKAFMYKYVYTHMCMNVSQQRLTQTCVYVCWWGGGGGGGKAFNVRIIQWPLDNSGLLLTLVRSFCLLS